MLVEVDGQNLVIRENNISCWKWKYIYPQSWQIFLGFLVGYQPGPFCMHTEIQHNINNEIINSRLFHTAQWEG